MARALLASPTSVSTSVGRKSRGSISTSTLQVAFSKPFSSRPRPRQMIVLPTWALRSGSLVEAGLVPPAENADGVEQAQSAKSVGVRGVFRGHERHLHMRLCCEIVDLVRLRFPHDADDIGRVGYIAIVQLEGDALLVRVVDEMVNALGVERRDRKSVV